VNLLVVLPTPAEEKILPTIVRSVSVDVMNNFPRSQPPADARFHD
jgi:hypothetical protein